MIKLLIALGAEAKPLIAHFKLKKTEEPTPFKVYRNDLIELVTSGSGRISMAAATAWLGGISPHTRSIWLNIGTAGHGNLQVGSACIAHKVQEAASKRSWYPPQIIKTHPLLLSTELITVDHVQTAYENLAYDMEASAFIATAHRFADAECVQSLKIISDTPEAPVSLLTPATVSTTIEAHITTIEHTLNALVTLHQKVYHDALSIDIEPFLSRWRFTISQHHQLYETLRRWLAVRNDTPFDNISHQAPKTAAQVLHLLNTSLKHEAPKVSSTCPTVFQQDSSGQAVQ